MTTAEPINRRKQHPYHAVVVSVTAPNSQFRRLVLHCDDFDDFAFTGQTDSYVKLVFLCPEVEYPRPIDLRAVRASSASHQQPATRAYTVRRFDAERLELTVDIFVHEAEDTASDGSAGNDALGPGARLAVTAQPGDEVLLLGPGGGYTPDATASWHLYIGDESALPAIAASLERLAAMPEVDPGNVFVFIEVSDEHAQVPIDTDFAIRWIPRGERVIGEALTDAVRELEFVDSHPDAFVHGEAALVKQLRELLLVERGIARESLSISGYWRAGATDEQWRAVKAEWALNA